MRKNYIFIIAIVAAVIFSGCFGKKSAKFQVIESVYTEHSDVLGIENDSLGISVANKMVLTKQKKKGEISYLMDFYQNNEKLTRIVIAPERLKSNSKNQGDTVYYDTYSPFNYCRIHYELNKNILNIYNNNFDTLTIASSTEFTSVGQILKMYNFKIIHNPK